MPHEVTLPNGYTITDERGRLDIGVVHDLLTGAYWAERRPRAITKRSFANCLCFGIFAPDGAMAGFGRVLTDYATRAHLADVFIRPEARGLGLGRALVGTILGHPELATVTVWTLASRDAQGLYAKFGFSPGEPNPGWMTLKRRDD